MLLTLLLTQGSAGPQAYTLDAQPGAFTLSGQAATTARSLSLNAAAGSFTYTGQAATFAYSAPASLTAESGGFTLSGQAATLTASRQLVASSASFTLTGQAASTQAERNTAANAGGYTLSGQAATLAKAGVFSPAAGAFAISGQPATFVIASSSFTAEAGSFGPSTWADPAYVDPAYASGTSATLLVGRMLTALAGNHTITGGDAELTVQTQQGGRAGFEMGGRKVYIKRGKRIHIFDTVEDADAWVEAEQQTRRAIQKAKVSSKRKPKVYQALDEQIPHQVIQLDALQSLVEYYGIPVELPTLEAQQDWMEVARIALLAREMQDEEEVEMLLFA